MAVKNIWCSYREPTPSFQTQNKRRFRKALEEHIHEKFKFTISNILAQKPTPEEEPGVCR